MSFIKYRKFEVESYEPFKLFGMEVTLFDVNHPPLRRSHGVRIDFDGFKVVISGDTNKDIPARSIGEMMGPDLFVVEALAPSFKFRKHMNAEDALRVAREIRAKKIILTHVGHFYPPHPIAAKKYPLGRDFQTFSFGEEATLDEF
jgi:phosphoribosyl 1,2-cyclic phosphate phosphodiesterase